MTLRCIAIDDEPLALQKIEGYCARIPFLQLVAVFTNPIDAITFLNKETVQLMFLDIQMDGVSGIQLLETLKVTPKVIITSAYDQYALKSYEFDVADYLLKPYSFARFLAAAHKTLTQVMAPLPASAVGEPPRAEPGFIFVKDGSRISRIVVAEILYIEGMKEYLRFHTVSGRVMTLGSFRKVEELLPAGQFVRVHRSFLVAIDKIDRIGSHSLYVGEREIPLGDTYRQAFLERIKRLIH